MKTSKKDFDCVEMKRQGQDLLRQRLAGMSREEVLAYWQQRNLEFEAELARSRAAAKVTPPST